MGQVREIQADVVEDCVAMGHAVKRYPWLSIAIALFAAVELSSAWQHSVTGMVASPLVFWVVAMWRIDANRVRLRIARHRAKPSCRLPSSERAPGAVRRAGRRGTEAMRRCLAASHRTGHPDSAGA